MTFCKDIHGPQRMKPTDSGDPPGEGQLCLSAQCEFVMVDPGRSEEPKRSTRKNDILTVFLEGLGAGDRSAVTVEDSHH